MEYIEYNEAFGPVKFQEGFEQELKGRSIEEQIHCYGWSVDISNTKPYQTIEQLCEEDPWWRKHIEPAKRGTPIVRDGLVVGFRVETCFRDDGDYFYILPYEGYRYDCSEDNNGAGYKTRYWYKYLICLPFDHKLW